MDNQRVLNVTVFSPTQILYQGPALSVSSKNLVGDFDILPEHANMITFIEAMHPIEIRLEGKNKSASRSASRRISFKFPMAIIYVRANQVTIYSQPEIISL